MYCPNCGNEVRSEDTYCVKCGTKLKNTSNTTGRSDSWKKEEEDAPSTGFAILSFFIPIVGLILYLVWKDTAPFRAKSAGKGALYGAIVYVALIMLKVIISIILVAATAGTILSIAG